MKRKNRNLGWRVLRVLLLTVLCINLLTMLFTATDLRTRLKWLPYAALTVESGSMEPELSAGDLLVVKETAFSKLQIGNDVTFHQGNQLVTHRIVGKSGNYFITQGLSNNVPDSALMGPEEYCAKVIRVVPSLGWLLDALTSPFQMVLTSLLILAAFWGIPMAARLLDRHAAKENVTPRKKINVGRRLLLSLSMISLLLVTPFMTGAKYTAELNQYSTVVSSALHFSSNYLSEDGNRYTVQGWNGNPYNLTLSIKNYDNDLLMNQEGTDLVYGLAVEQLTENGCSDSYTVSIDPMENAGVTEADETQTFSFPDAWSNFTEKKQYIILGGETKLEHRFLITITPTQPLAANTVIHFRLYACTSEDRQYFIQLFGDFTFKVAATQEFIGEERLLDQGALVKYSIITNLISEGTATKLVKFQWNPNNLYINEFESSAYNIIVNWPETYYDKAQGAIYMPLQAYSSVNLQFFKVNPEFDPTGSITATVVDEITTETEAETETGQE